MSWANGATAKTYLNGASIAASAGNCGTPTGLPSTFYIGQQQDSTVQMSTNIHRLVGFSTALSDAEVATLSTVTLAGIHAPRRSFMLDSFLLRG